MTFTDAEYRAFIQTSPVLRAMLDRARHRWIVGVHYNSAHQVTGFRPDPIIDFHMAGPGDLVPEGDRPFLQLPMDCSNFCPAFFAEGATDGRKFWDVLAVSRAAGFKNLHDLMEIARRLLDSRPNSRILALVPHDGGQRGRGPIVGLLREYQTRFSVAERKLFVLLPLSIDYPFPFDLETLAFYYRHARVFLHMAPVERHPRVVAYAWASGLPVVAHPEAAALLPGEWRAPPGFYRYEQVDEGAAQLQHALNGPAPGNRYAQYHLEPVQVRRLKVEISRLFAALSQPYEDANWCIRRLDIRLARHHNGRVSPNTFASTPDQWLSMLCDGHVPCDESIDDPESAIERAVSAMPANRTVRWQWKIGAWQQRTASFAFRSLGRLSRVVPK